MKSIKKCGHNLTVRSVKVQYYTLKKKWNTSTGCYHSLPAEVTFFWLLCLSLSSQFYLVIWIVLRFCHLMPWPLLALGFWTVFWLPSDLEHLAESSNTVLMTLTSIHHVSLISLLGIIHYTINICSVLNPKWHVCMSLWILIKWEKL